MNLKLDDADRKHLIGNMLAAGTLGVLILIAIYLHPALAMAACGFVFPWAIERYQAIRHEGTPSKRDIVLGAIPFEIIAVAWWLLF